MLPAEQELEDAPLGRGVVLLHVGGDVAATETRGQAGPGPSEGSQPQGTEVTPEEPGPEAAYPGEGVQGSPITWGTRVQRGQDHPQHQARQAPSMLRPGPGRCSGCHRFLGAFPLRSLSLWAASGVPWPCSLSREPTHRLPCPNHVTPEGLVCSGPRGTTTGDPSGTLAKLSVGTGKLDWGTGAEVKAGP